MLIIILAFLMSVFSLAQSPAFAASLPSEMQNHINAERHHAGLSSLQLDDNLVRAAEIRVVEIQTKFAHQRLDGRDVKTVLKNHSFSRFGENLAVSETLDAERIIRAWMQSPSHRVNILGRHYTSMGIACQQNKNDGHYYCSLLLGG